MRGLTQNDTIISNAHINALRKLDAHFFETNAFSQFHLANSASPRTFAIVSHTSGIDLFAYVFWARTLPIRLQLQPLLFLLPLLVLESLLLILSFLLLRRSVPSRIRGDIKRNIPRLESSVRRHENAREFSRKHVASRDGDDCHEERFVRV